MNFNSGRDIPVAEARILISEELRNTLFRGVPAVPGRRLWIDGNPVVVIGVLPSEFRFPSWNTLIWRATDFADTRSSAALGEPVVYVRFAADVPAPDALRAATLQAHDADSSTSRLWAHAEPLSAVDGGSYYSRAIPLFSAAAVLLFCVLCANVANLMLLGFTARQREFATRAAVGASRGQLMREAVAECLLTGFGGIAAGVVLAFALVSVSRAILPEAAMLHSLNPLNLDLRALGVAIGAGICATVAVGAGTALVGTRVDAAEVLRRRAGGGSPLRSLRFARRLLLSMQIALSCMLLFAATMLVRSFVNLGGVERGFDTRRLVVARMQFSGDSLKTESDRSAAAETVTQRALAIPGIVKTAWSYGVPPGGGATVAGLTSHDESEVMTTGISANHHIVGPEFFDAYELTILRGRGFGPSDDPRAVLVSERFATSMWPSSADVIQRTFELDNRAFHVIGVVRELRYPALDRTLDRPQFYTRLPAPNVVAMLTLRCGHDCPNADFIRKELSSAHPGVRAGSTSTLEDVYVREFARPRAAAALAFAFAAIALVGTTVGLFVLMSHNVARRRREFGVRAALGASPRRVGRMVLIDVVSLTLPGLALGIFASVSLSSLIVSLLYDVTTHDVANWAIVLGSFLAATIVAASYPLRTAVQSPSLLAMRED